jgi:hypothetical protein
MLCTKLPQVLLQQQLSTTGLCTQLSQVHQHQHQQQWTPGSQRRW